MVTHTNNQDYEQFPLPVAVATMPGSDFYEGCSMNAICAYLPLVRVGAVNAAT
jgi:hypothetical protein